MNPAKDAFLFRELQVIQKIIQDETWLEGERRGTYVSPDDPVVRERVCLIVLRIGQSLRDSLTQANIQPRAEFEPMNPAEPVSTATQQEVAA
jgi:hypothetical protein